jgi:hypothetical protein
MKTTNTLIIVLLTIGICSGGNSSAQETTKLNINEIINEYDPIMSAVQYYYRQWIEKENQEYFNNEDLLEPNKINDLNYIKTNIEQLLSFVDTVKSYFEDHSYISSEYGEKLKAMIKDSNGELEFQTKWREYNNGVAEVMAYDIEMIGKYLTIFYFLRDNRTSYEVGNDMVYFLDEESREKYLNLLENLADPKLSSEQELIRMKTVHKYADAINYAKEHN